MIEVKIRFDPILGSAQQQDHAHDLQEALNNRFGQGDMPSSAEAWKAIRWWDKRAMRYPIRWSNRDGTAGLLVASNDMRSVEDHLEQLIRPHSLCHVVYVRSHGNRPTVEIVDDIFRERRREQ